jgi:hypothetical protein
MEKKLKVEELYECSNFLSGVTFNNGKEDVKIVGFCNEKSISEGIRRIANKTLKKIAENIPKEQFQAIGALSFIDLYPSGLPEDYEETEEEKGKLVALKQSKIKELLDSEVTIVFEELPDWELMNKRLEESKQNLSQNYVYLFERLFLNY